MKYHIFRLALFPGDLGLMFGHFIVGTEALRWRVLKIPLRLAVNWSRFHPIFCWTLRRVWGGQGIVGAEEFQPWDFWIL